MADDIDDQDWSEIIRVQLQQMEALIVELTAIPQLNYEQRGDLSALRFQLEELREDAAEREDDSLLTEIDRLEAAANASQLAQGNTQPANPEPTRPVTNTAAANQPGQAGPAPANTDLAAELKYKCPICTIRRPIDWKHTAACGDIYCHMCLRKMFRDSLKEGGKFPPKCCNVEIPIANVAVLLGSKLTTKYRISYEERSTPNRTYCHHKKCGKFVSPKFIVNDVAACPKCGDETCAICKKERHHGTAECPEDENYKALLATGKEEGWQRCTKCNSIVDLVDGCNHMTCLCGYEFCYVCGAPWKTCDCPQWDEDNIVDEGEVESEDEDDEEEGGDVPNGPAQAAA